MKILFHVTNLKLWCFKEQGNESHQVSGVNCAELGAGNRNQHSLALVANSCKAPFVSLGATERYSQGKESSPQAPEALIRAGGKINLGIRNFVLIIW